MFEIYQELVQLLSKGKPAVHRPQAVETDEHVAKLILRDACLDDAVGKRVEETALRGDALERLPLHQLEVMRPEKQSLFPVNVT